MRSVSMSCHTTGEQRELWGLREAQRLPDNWWVCSSGRLEIEVVVFVDSQRDVEVLWFPLGILSLYLLYREYILS